MRTVNFNLTACGTMRGRRRDQSFDLIYTHSIFPINPLKIPVKNMDMRPFSHLAIMIMKIVKLS